MEKIVASGTFRLKGRDLFALGLRNGAKNLHQVSKNSVASYPTVRRYIENPKAVEAIKLEALASFLVDGLRISPESLAKMPFGDVFEFVRVDPKETE
jgi:hypothetical protein